MIDISLDNSDNDKTMEIKLPIVPRIGDWISLDDDEFTGGESLLTVVNVVLTPDREEIKVVVRAD